MPGAKGRGGRRIGTGRPSKRTLARLQAEIDSIRDEMRSRIDIVNARIDAMELSQARNRNGSETSPAARLDLDP